MVPALIPSIQVPFAMNYRTILVFAEQFRICSRREMLYYLMRDELIPNVGEEIIVWPFYEKHMIEYTTYKVLMTIAKTILKTDNFSITNV